jgi:amidophosphoribosyltransferase
MAKLGDFIAFQAAINLLKERNMSSTIDEVYANCRQQENLQKRDVYNAVKEIYKPFTTEEISFKISQLLTPENMRAEVCVVFQSIDGLHQACPQHKGDWYFTGNYPTPGGNQVVNRAFINYCEGKNRRAY